MAMKLYSDTAIQDIADAIRSKNGSSDTYTVSEMAQAIEDIETGGGGVSWDDIVMRNYSGDIVVPNATQIDDYSFNNTGITSLSAPNVTSIGASCIYNNTSLTSINLPKLQRSDNYGMARNTNANLKAIVLPAMTTTGTYLAERVYATLDFTALSNIVANAFRSWYGKVLILRKSDAICTLANASTTFQSSPFASGGSGGTLYVPQALISSYQSATNWSTILGYANNQILPIEGSIYETQYADGTPIE